MVAGSGLDYIIGEVDEKLSQAALGGGIVSENRRECRIAEGFGEALSESLASAGVVAEPARC